MTIRRAMYDATKFDPTPGDVAEVIVVGAGPSGAVAAEFLSTFGLQVVCLDQGDWVGSPEYTVNRVVLLDQPRRRCGKVCCPTPQRSAHTAACVKIVRRTLGEGAA